MQCSDMAGMCYSQHNLIKFKHITRDGEVTFQKELSSSYFQMKNLGTLVT